MARRGNSGRRARELSWGTDLCMHDCTLARHPELGLCRKNPGVQATEEWSAYTKMEPSGSLVDPLLPWHGATPMSAMPFVYGMAQPTHLKIMNGTVSLRHTRANSAAPQRKEYIEFLGSFSLGGLAQAAPCSSPPTFESTPGACPTSALLHAGPHTADTAAQGSGLSPFSSIPESPPCFTLSRLNEAQERYISC